MERHQQKYALPNVHFDVISIRIIFSAEILTIYSSFQNILCREWYWKNIYPKQFWKTVKIYSKTLLLQMVENCDLILIHKYNKQ